MQVLNLDEKNVECMEAIDKFTLMDDTLGWMICVRQCR